MFITLESSEGAGKGTLSQLACLAMQLSGTDFVHTRQPGGTPEAEKIREMFLDKEHHFSLEEEILLLGVARKRVWEEIISPALKEGKVVLCERWHATTAAYQGYARTIGREGYRNMVLSYMSDNFRHLGLMDQRPDLSIFLQVDTAVGLERARVRGELDRLESMGVEFLDVANEALLSFHQKRTHWMMKDAAIVDANRPLTSVAINFLACLVTAGVTTEAAAKQAFRETFHDQ